MEKPNADIEWYDDGFTMEEQAKLREEYFKYQPKITISTKQQEDWKDKMISDLKMKNAANEEYIKELEDQIQQLQKDNEKVLNAKQSLADKLNIMMKRYSRDIKEYTQSEEFQQKYKNQIDELKKEKKN